MVPMGCNFGDIDNDGYLDFLLDLALMSFPSSRSFRLNFRSPT